MHNSSHHFDSRKLIYQDDEIAIHAGNVFKAKTVKGDKVHILAMRVVNGYMIWMRANTIKGKEKGDVEGTALKTPIHEFVRLVKNGELEDIPISRMDPDRLTANMIILDSVANKRTVNEHLAHLEAAYLERSIDGQKSDDGRGFDFQT